MATSHTPCNLAVNLKLNSFTKIQEYQKFSKKPIGFSASFIWSLGVIRVKNWQSSIFRKMYFLENIQKFHQNLDFRLFPKVTPWCQIEVPPPQIINFSSQDILIQHWPIPSSRPGLLHFGRNFIQHKHSRYILDLYKWK